MHRADYGDYVIGFDSDWESSKRLRPLKYVTEKDKAIPLLKPRHIRELTKCDHVDTGSGLIHFPPTKLKLENLGDVWDILPYLKENLGFTFQRMLNPCSERHHIPLCKKLKDEHEWRFIPEKHRNNLFSVEDYTVATMNELNTLSEATRDSYLTFNQLDVAIVIVKTDGERQQLATQYPELALKIRIWDELELEENESTH